MNLARITQCAVLLGLYCGVLLSGCASTPGGDSDKNTEAQIEAAEQVLERLRPHLGDAYPQGVARFDMGDLDDGYAVMLVEVNGTPVDAAFWTRGPAVYVVNDAARAMNAKLPDAPETITLERVRAVVH